MNVTIVIIVAFNLRAPITAIGPIINIIQGEYNLNSTLADMLTSLPLITSGSTSFIMDYFSPIRAIVVGTFLIFIAELIRSHLGVYGLFLGVLGIGCGIAIADVLLPGFIKEKFLKKMASMMGVYSLVLNISSIAGITLSVLLLNIFDSTDAMIFWSAFSFTVLMTYYPQVKDGRFFRTRKKESKKINLLKNPTAWKITLFMGFQSFLAYSLFFWYAQIIVKKDYDKDFATNVVLFSQLVAVPTSLFSPLLLRKPKKSLCTPYVTILCAMHAVSFGILPAFDTRFMVMLAIFIAGFSWGGVFDIILLFIAQKSSNVKIAARLPAFAQRFGYSIAAQRQRIIGFSHGMFENFTSSIRMLLIVGILVNIFGYLVYRNKVV